MIKKICGGFEKSEIRKELLIDMDQVNSKAYTDDEKINFKQEIK